MSFKDSDGSKRICEAIQRTTGMIAPGATFDAAAPGDLTEGNLAGHAGCLMVVNRFWAYQRI